jgi:hypothetical protein
LRYFFPELARAETRSNHSKAAFEECGQKGYQKRIAVVERKRGVDDIGGFVVSDDVNPSKQR